MTAMVRRIPCVEASTFPSKVHAMRGKSYTYNATVYEVLYYHVLHPCTSVDLSHVVHTFILTAATSTIIAETILPARELYDYGSPHLALFVRLPSVHRKYGVPELSFHRGGPSRSGIRQIKRTSRKI